jgi:hypothetical protein
LKISNFSNSGLTGTLELGKVDEITDKQVFQKKKCFDFCVAALRSSTTNLSTLAAFFNYIKVTHVRIVSISFALFLPGVEKQGTAPDATSEASLAIRRYELSDIFVAAISLALKFANGIIAVPFAASSFIKFNMLEIISVP